ncbi:MAG: hypothetical protein AAFN18_08035 [Cyanobacteria bacterium J06554_6]
MRCAKDLKVDLSDKTLSGGLMAHSCPQCEGVWIPSDRYQTWQAEHADPSTSISDLKLPSSLGVDYKPSPYDGRAGLCPQCGFYLVRGRINLKETAFFVERCPGCNGIWCDRGEWETLEKLGLASYIPLLFTDEWQSHVRVLEAAYREKQATADKLGPEIAEKLFELAKLLEAHPNGDFGVAYLMRRFEE